MVRQKDTQRVEEVSVRARMLASAMKLFSRKGYASTTVREIVTEAGVTKPVLYYYFGNKEGIYKELMEPPLVKFEALLLEFEDMEGPAKGLIMDLLDRLFALVVEHTEVARIMYSIYYGPPQGAPFIDFDAHHMRLQETVRRLVAKGVKQGEFEMKSDTESVIWAVIGALTIAMEMHLTHPERGLGRKGLARVLKLILDGVTRNKECGSRATGSRKGHTVRGSRVRTKAVNGRKRG